MSWHQLWYIESHNYYYKGEISLAYKFVSSLTPYILHRNLRNPQTLLEFPETPAKKGEIIETEVRKLKDIKGQKSPKLSDRGHPKPTIKKLIEENRGNYQILHLVHRPQKIIG